MTVKIYKIISNKSNDFYIGHSFMSLTDRLAHHTVQKTSSVFRWIYDNPGHVFHILEIAEYATLDPNVARAYEQLWINKLKPTINKIKAFCPLPVKCIHGHYRRVCEFCGERCEHSKQRLHCVICAGISCPDCKNRYTYYYYPKHICIEHNIST